MGTGTRAHRLTRARTEQEASGPVLSFEKFLAGIESRRLREVAEHWRRARGAYRMPRWSDIDPGEIVRQLPIVWAWKYDRAGGRFTGRLAGEEINWALGKPLRGADLVEFFGEAKAPPILARYRRVVDEPCFVHWRGQVFRHAERLGLGERIILPMAEDGATGDGVLGATIYNTAPAGGAAPAAGEEVDFYPLD